MTDNSNLEVPNDSPTVEVRAYRQGELIATELCLTVDEAAALVASWEETPGVTCEVGDLSTPTANGSAAEVADTDMEAGYSHGFDAQT